LTELVPASFFERDCLVVARDLLGCHLRRDDVLLRITEVEAYTGPDDTASHTRMGRTARNASMWGPRGRLYVYLCYGLHSMLNVVAGAREGEGAAVLVRSAEVVEGHAVVAARRGGRTDPQATAGPGKVGAALALHVSLDGHPLYEPGGIELRWGTPPERVLAGPRVGVGYASAEHQRAPWRLADGDSLAVTARKALSAV
jgi:DNA-3-methyladenine glycosylase